MNRPPIHFGPLRTRRRSAPPTHLCPGAEHRSKREGSARLYVPRVAACAGAAAILLATAASTSSFGQTDPTLFRAGVGEGSASQTIILYEVPADHYFVLTDITVNANPGVGDNFYMRCSLRQNSTTVWLAGTHINLPAGQFHQTDDIVAHFQTGLVWTPQQEVFFHGNIGNHDWTVSWSGYLVPFGLTSAEETLPASTEPSLARLRSNPFRDQARIDYALPGPGDARLRIIAPDGRVVRTLVDGRATSGESFAVWDGRDAHGRRAPSGTYFYDLRLDGRTVANGKAVLIR